MYLPLTDGIAQPLRAYLREIKATPSETGKRERFTSLLGQLFGSTREVARYIQGAETPLRIQTLEATRRGRADTVFGSAVIEFEKDLKKTLKHAEDQLRDYVAGIWQSDKPPYRALDAVATDGLCWRLYRPVLREGATLVPENIILELRREIVLKSDTLNDFYRWLNLFLFRPSNVEPSSEAIKEDFGSYSHLCHEALAALRRAWAVVRHESEARLARDTWQSYLTVTYGKLSETDKSKAR